MIERLAICRTHWDHVDPTCVQQHLCFVFTNPMYELVKKRDYICPEISLKPTSALYRNIVMYEKHIGSEHFCGLQKKLVFHSLLQHLRYEDIKFIWKAYDSLLRRGANHWTHTCTSYQTYSACENSKKIFQLIQRSMTADVAILDVLLKPTFR
jgi:hypothetical protein